jgi:hypothetical protein
MSDTSSGRLSGEEVLALKFAAHRQLTRWANNPRLSPDQHARRNALRRAVAVLRDEAFARGCDLRAPDTGRQG